MKQLFFIYMFLYCFPLFAHKGIDVKVNTKSLVVGEHFCVQYKISDVKIKELKEPTYNAVIQIVDGPKKVVSNETINVKGVLKFVETTVITYVFRATKIGKYKIDKLSILTSEDEKIESDEIIVEVVQEASKLGSLNLKKSLFAKVILSENHSFIGSPILATIKLYTMVNLEDLEISKLSNIKGVTSEIIELPKQTDANIEELDGISYIVFDVQKISLVSNQPGTFEIPSIELKTIAIIPTNARPQKPKSEKNLWFDYSDIATEINSGIYDPMHYRQIPLTIFTQPQKIAIEKMR